MLGNRDLYIPVTTTPKKILDKDEKRLSWHITNIGLVSVYYLRGERGSGVATSGNSQGIPIEASDTDGYSEIDAVDEVWVISSSATAIIVGVTV